MSRLAEIQRKVWCIIYLISSHTVFTLPDPVFSRQSPVYIPNPASGRSSGGGSSSDNGFNAGDSNDNGEVIPTTVSPSLVEPSGRDTNVGGVGGDEPVVEASSINTASDNVRGELDASSTFHRNRKNNGPPRKPHRPPPRHPPPIKAPFPPPPQKPFVIKPSFYNKPNKSIYKYHHDDEPVPKKPRKNKRRKPPPPPPSRHRDPNPPHDYDHPTPPHHHDYHPSPHHPDHPPPRHRDPPPPHHHDYHPSPHHPNHPPPRHRDPPPPHDYDHPTPPHNHDYQPPPRHRDPPPPNYHYGHSDHGGGSNSIEILPPQPPPHHKEKSIEDNRRPSLKDLMRDEVPNSSVEGKSFEQSKHRDKDHNYSYRDNDYHSPSGGSSGGDSTSIEEKYPPPPPPSSKFPRSPPPPPSYPEPSPSAFPEDPAPFPKPPRPVHLSYYYDSNDKQDLKTLITSHHLKRRGKECDGLENFLYDLDVISFMIGIVNFVIGLYTTIIPFFNDGVKISYSNNYGDGADFPHDYWNNHDGKIDAVITKRSISVGTKEDNVREVLSVSSEFISWISLGISFLGLFPHLVEKFFYLLDWWFGKRGLWKQYLYTYKCEIHPYPKDEGWGWPQSR